MWPVRRHALLIAPNPDGEDIQPAERHREREKVDNETWYTNTAPRDDAQEEPPRRASGRTSMWMCPEGAKRTGPHPGVGGQGSSAGEPVPAMVPCAPATPRSTCNRDQRRTC